jgi:hypothetical protein
MTLVFACEVLEPSGNGLDLGDIIFRTEGVRVSSGEMSPPQHCMVYLASVTLLDAVRMALRHHKSATMVATDSSFVVTMQPMSKREFVLEAGRQPLGQFSGNDVLRAIVAGVECLLREHPLSDDDIVINDLRAALRAAHEVLL